MLLKYYCFLNILVYVTARIKLPLQFIRYAPSRRTLEKEDNHKEKIYNDVVNNISRVNSIIEELIHNYEKLKNMYHSQEKLSDDYSSDSEIDEVYKQKRARDSRVVQFQPTTTRNPFDVATEMFFSEEHQYEDEDDNDNTENDTEETETVKEITTTLQPNVIKMGDNNEDEKSTKRERIQKQYQEDFKQDNQGKSKEENDTEETETDKEITTSLQPNVIKMGNIYEDEKSTKRVRVQKQYHEDFKQNNYGNNEDDNDNTENDTEETETVKEITTTLQPNVIKMGDNNEDEKSTKRVRIQKQYHEDFKQDNHGNNEDDNDNTENDTEETETVKEITTNIKLNVIKMGDNNENEETTKWVRIQKQYQEDFKLDNHGNNEDEKAIKRERIQKQNKKDFKQDNRESDVMQKFENHERNWFTTRQNEMISMKKDAEAAIGSKITEHLQNQESDMDATITTKRKHTLIKSKQKERVKMVNIDNNEPTEPTTKKISNTEKIPKDVEDQDSESYESHIDTNQNTNQSNEYQKSENKTRAYTSGILEEISKFLNKHSGKNILRIELKKENAVKPKFESLQKNLEQGIETAETNHLQINKNERETRTTNKEYDFPENKETNIELYSEPQKNDNESSTETEDDFNSKELQKRITNNANQENVFPAKKDKIIKPYVEQFKVPQTTTDKTTLQAPREILKTISSQYIIKEEDNVYNITPEIMLESISDEKSELTDESQSGSQIADNSSDELEEIVQDFEKKNKYIEVNDNDKLAVTEKPRNRFKIQHQNLELVTEPSITARTEKYAFENYFPLETTRIIRMGTATTAISDWKLNDPPPTPRPPPEVVKQNIRVEAFTEDNIWAQILNSGSVNVNSANQIVDKQVTQPRIYFRDQLEGGNSKMSTSSLMSVIRDFYKTNKHLANAQDFLFRRLDDTTKLSAESIEEEQTIKREQFQTRILRAAYGDACLKVVVRKCWKACKASYADACKKYTCTEGFKTVFRKNAKTSCIREFSRREQTKLRSGGGLEITNFQDIIQDGYLAAACLPVRRKLLLRSNTSIQESRPFVKLNILRDRFEKACQEASAAKCTVACSNAVDKSCEETECKGKKKEHFKKQCKRDCKKSYRGKKLHSKTKSHSSSSGSSGSSGSSDSSSGDCSHKGNCKHKRKYRHKKWKSKKGSTSSSSSSRSQSSSSSTSGSNSESSESSDSLDGTSDNATKTKLNSKGEKSENLQASDSKKGKKEKTKQKGEKKEEKDAKKEEKDGKKEEKEATKEEKYSTKEEKETTQEEKEQTHEDNEEGQSKKERQKLKRQRKTKKDKKSKKKSKRSKKIKKENKKIPARIGGTQKTSTATKLKPDNSTNTKS